MKCTFLCSKSVMRTLRLIVLPALLLAVACTVKPSDERQLDVEEEFAKLDTPQVGSVEGSLRRAAETAEEKGEHARAVSLYSQLHDRYENNVGYQFGLAESLRRVGENEAAIAMYDKVLGERPQYLDAMEGKALAIMAMGDTEEASRQFKTVLERDAGRWRTLNALGILFTVKNMTTEALAYFNEALKHSPDNPSVMNNIGLVKATRGEERAAVDALRTAAKQASGKQRQHIEMNLALVYGISGDIEAAKRVAEPHLTEASLTHNLGLYAHLANNDELAKSYLNMAMTNSSVYYERAWKNLNIIANQARGSKDLSPQQKTIKIGE